MDTESDASVCSVSPDEVTASDADYVLRIEGAADGTYEFVVPFGTEDGFCIRDDNPDEDDEEVIVEEGRAFCSGVVGPDGLDGWTLTSTDQPIPVEECDCTISVFQQV